MDRGVWQATVYAIVELDPTEQLIHIFIRANWEWCTEISVLFLCMCIYNYLSKSFDLKTESQMCLRKENIPEIYSQNIYQDQPVGHEPKEDGAFLFQCGFDHGFFHSV